MKSKNLLLTGATGGIGKALATKLAKQGMRLILVGRNLSKLQALAESLPGNHHTIASDLNSEDGRQSILSTLLQLNIKLDYLVNAAGVCSFELLEDSSSHTIDQTIQSNLVSPMLLTQLLLPSMNPLGARIINIGSTFGNIGYPGYSSYCASKFGLRGFSQALSRELADSKIKVQYLAPRATNTSMNNSIVTQMNKSMGNHVDSPEDLAQMIIKSMGSNKSSVFFGYPEKIFIFLNNIASPLVDTAIAKKLPSIKQFAKRGLNA